MTSDIVVYDSGEIELKISIEHERICLRAEDIALIFDVHRPAFRSLTSFSRLVNLLTVIFWLFIV
jgi:hypothetical protein